MRKTAPASSLALVLLTAPLAAALALAPASAARADDSVMVLGLTSVEGDDDYARSLTGAIRHEASQVPGWQVSDREVTFTQMSLAHGCDEPPDASCLRQIATTLNAQRVIFGTIRRDSSQDFRVSVSIFNAQSGEIERSVEETLPGRRTDIDDLREPAQRIARQLGGPQTGALRIASNAPNATVSIDGSVAGTTDPSGEFAMPEIPVGAHRVSVALEGRETWTGSVTIARGTEMTLDADLEEGAGGGGGGGGDGPSINWPAIALIAGGVVAFGGSIYTWARIQAIQSDERYQAYRNGWPDPAPTDVCALASGGTAHGGVSPAEVSDLCSEASTLEILQYVFLGVAVAAGATGAVLMVLDATSSSGESEGGGGPEVTLVPGFGPDGASIGARVRF